MEVRGNYHLVLSSARQPEFFKSGHEKREDLYKYIYKVVGWHGSMDGSDFFPFIGILYQSYPVLSLSILPCLSIVSTFASIVITLQYSLQGTSDPISMTPQHLDTSYVQSSSYVPLHSTPSFTPPCSTPHRNKT